MRKIAGLLFALAAVVQSHGQTGNTSSPPFMITISAPRTTVKLGEPLIVHIVLKSTTEGQLTLPEERHTGDREE